LGTFENVHLQNYVGYNIQDLIIDYHVFLYIYLITLNEFKF